MRGEYRYLTLSDRKKISKLWLRGERVGNIAAAIGSNETLIYRELRRGWDGTTNEMLRRTYDPVLADNRFRQVLSERGRKNASGSKKRKGAEQCKEII